MESVIVQVQSALWAPDIDLRVFQVEPSGEEGVKDVRVSWAYTDDFLGSTILQAIQSIHWETVFEI